MSLIVVWLMMLASGGGVGLPLGVPPLPEDPVLAKIAPEECLLYFSSAGMAKPDAKSSNQTEKLFAEPELQQLAAEVEKLIRSRLKEAAKDDKPEAKTLAADGPTLLKALLTRPLAVYVAEVKLVPKAPPEVRAGAVVSLGEDADKLKAALERCLSVLVADKAKDVTVEGTTFRRVPLPGGADLTWGVKGQYLYVAAGEGELEALLKRSGRSAPKWLTALHKDLPVERVSTVGMINVKGLTGLLAPLGGPEVPKVLEATGLAGVERLAGVSGLDKEGFVSRSLVSLGGERKGLFQLFDQKPLTPAEVDLIPRDATFALALKLDTGKAWSTILATIEKIDPKEKEKMLGQLGESQRELLDEVFKALGDTWCVFDSPGEGGLFTGVTAVVSIKDADAAAAVQKKLLSLADGGGDRRAQVEKFTFGGQTVHVFASREKNFPLAPSWCLTDKHLILAAYPGAIKGFLSRGKGFQGLTKVPEVAAQLERPTIALSYTDTRRLFDLAYPLLPVFFQMLGSEMRHEGIDVPAELLPSAGSIRRHLRPSVAALRRTPAGIEVDSRQTLPGNMGMSTHPVAAGLLILAVQKVREAAARMESSNNLKQIALAVLNSNDANGNFPAAYSVNKDGKPLLSWRVHILPYIAQDNLYKQFHLDEPWDSAHNKKLIDKMPKTYRSPASAAPPGRTNYLTVRGKDTVFPGDKGVKISEITDGTSNTIMVVEASDKKAVIWTKPDDFELNEKDPIAGLVGLWSQGFQAAFCDGSVRMISRSIDPKDLKNFFIRNDGNPPPPDK
ncbi:MAG TPA: DUF1559 domain-containing protein [Gemmataceae bacterium]|nr:DUF1559 domain-containing protein [Gemmataceae bacterium]